MLTRLKNAYLGQFKNQADVISEFQAPADALSGAEVLMEVCKTRQLLSDLRWILMGGPPGPIEVRWDENQGVWLNGGYNGRRFKQSPANA